MSGSINAGLTSYQQKRANYKAALKIKGTSDMLDYSLTDIKVAVNKDDKKIDNKATFKNPYLTLGPKSSDSAAAV